MWTTDRKETLMLLDVSSMLGPARVLAAKPGVVRVRREEDLEEVDAVPALATLYDPVPGDIVLLVGQGERHYVIGLLKGCGTTVITAPGDLELRAPRGAIKLVAAKSLVAEAPDLSLRAGRLRFVARTLSERFERACRSIKGLFQVRAGRMRTIVDGTVHVKAEWIVERAEKDVLIDGSSIRLG